jgi:hypothetical protein
LVSDASFNPYLIAAPSATDLLVSNAGAGSDPLRLMFSSDGGQHWSTVASEGMQSQLEVPTHSYLGFENSDVGRWVAFPDAIWTTADGGGALGQAAVSIAAALRDREHAGRRWDHAKTRLTPDGQVLSSLESYTPETVRVAAGIYELSVSEGDRWTNPQKVTVTAGQIRTVKLGLSF